MNVMTVEKETLYKTIRDLPDEKAALVMGFVQRLITCDEEPPLTQEEKDGLCIADAELARGEGRSFAEAFDDLW